jgi:hypothetical protein
VGNLRSFDLRLTSGSPLLRSVILLCVSQDGCQDATEESFLSFTGHQQRDTHNGDRKKSSDQAYSAIFEQKGDISGEAEPFAQYFFENWTTGPDSWRGRIPNKTTAKGGELLH